MMSVDERSLELSKADNSSTKKFRTEKASFVLTSCLCEHSCVFLVFQFSIKKTNEWSYNVKTQKENPVAQHAVTNNLQFDYCYTVKS